ncbi:MAG TPA: gamma-glutamyl-gamma-aminobutyrate hydrolase family protein [Candidatus Acidoferrum sp.]|nr:gamma-glutamyl-gamma-aminobutyrate hydrolase family protein [Candidatus Acidoferrum sp.]
MTTRIIPHPRDLAHRTRIVVTASIDDPVAEYLDALREAGAEPVRVDALVDPGNVLDGVGGLLVTGGVDVAPARYGAPPSPQISHVQPERDALEIALLQAARERALPTFCICRGLQIANVAFGGTLIPDIPTALGEAATIAHAVKRADGRSERGLIEGHVVRIESDSRLVSIVGATELLTGSRHHQSVDRYAEELRVVARTADDIVEALEARFASPFWLAVQWHPESTRELDRGASRALFHRFVEAAREGALRR